MLFRVYLYSNYPLLLAIIAIKHIFLYFLWIRNFIVKFSKYYGVEFCQSTYWVAELNSACCKTSSNHFVPRVGIEPIAITDRHYAGNDRLHIVFFAFFRLFSPYSTGSNTVMLNNILYTLWKNTKNNCILFYLITIHPFYHVS